MYEIIDNILIGVAGIALVYTLFFLYRFIKGLISYEINKVYMLIFIGSSIFLYLLFNSFVYEPITIDYNKFENMLSKNYISKIVVIRNQETVEITLNNNALINSIYRDELESYNLLNNTYGPHYKFNVSSVIVFKNRYEELVNSLEKSLVEIEYLTESRSKFYYHFPKKFLFYQ